MRKTKILIVVITVILLGVTLVVNRYYDIIKAFYYSQKYSNQEIDKLIQNHYDEIDKYLKENEKYKVRPSTKLEEKLHASGLISDEELTKLLTGKITMYDIFGFDIGLNDSEKIVKSDGTVISLEDLKSAKDGVSLNSDQKSQEDDPSENPQPSSKDEPSSENKNPGSDVTKESVDDKVSEYIAQVYVLKSSFESQLNSIYLEAKAQYISIPYEQRKSSKSTVLKMFYGRATALEASCDAQVNAVLSELESTLKSAGESTEIVSKIRTAYEEEKSLKKAYYINLYNS